MNDTEQRQAAQQFADNWKNRGDEKQDTQSFWHYHTTFQYLLPENALFAVIIFGQKRCFTWNNFRTHGKNLLA